MQLLAGARGGVDDGRGEDAAVGKLHIATRRVVRTTKPNQRLEAPNILEFWKPRLYIVVWRPQAESKIGGGP